MNWHYNYLISSKNDFPAIKDADDYYYTMRDIIFFLENDGTSVQEYRRKVYELKLVAVVSQY
jgi:hypothetical protein